MHNVLKHLAKVTEQLEIASILVDRRWNAIEVASNAMIAERVKIGPIGPGYTDKEEVICAICSRDPELLTRIDPSLAGTRRIVAYIVFGPSCCHVREWLEFHRPDYVETFQRRFDELLECGKQAEEPSDGAPYAWTNFMLAGTISGLISYTKHLARMLAASDTGDKDTAPAKGNSLSGTAADMGELEAGHIATNRRTKQDKGWLGEALMLRRDHPDWPDRQIAEKVGVHRSTLSRNPMFQMATKMARDNGSTLPRGYRTTDPDTGLHDIEGLSDADDPAKQEWDD